MALSKQQASVWVLFKYQKGEVEQFYFSFHTLVPVLSQVSWGFSYVDPFSKAHEHCHLVVILGAPGEF